MTLKTMELIRHSWIQFMLPNVELLSTAELHRGLSSSFLRIDVRELFNYVGPVLLTRGSLLFFVIAGSSSDYMYAYLKLFLT